MRARSNLAAVSDTLEASRVAHRGAPHALHPAQRQHDLSTVLVEASTPDPLSSASPLHPTIIQAGPEEMIPFLEVGGWLYGVFYPGQPNNRSHVADQAGKLDQ